MISPSPFQAKSSLSCASETTPLLLEPGAPDSFFQWGFFSSVLQRTEYAESYVLEPLALEMLRQEPGLEEEFRQRLESDKEFAESPGQRLEWFYNRSPLLDSRWRLYPVGREVSVSVSDQ